MPQQCCCVSLTREISHTACGVEVCAGLHITVCYKKQLSVGEPFKNVCISLLLEQLHMNLTQRCTFCGIKPSNQRCSKAPRYRCTRSLLLLLVLQLLTWQTAVTFSAFPYFCYTPIGQCFIWPDTIGSFLIYCAGRPCDLHEVRRRSSERRR